MKAILSTLILIISVSLSAQTLDGFEKLPGVDVESKFVNGVAYFELRQTNEKENSVYVLTKIDDEGEESLIGSVNGYKNNLNQAILYSFKDETPSLINATYYLVNLTDSGKILSKFRYEIESIIVTIEHDDE